MWEMTEKTVGDVLARMALVPRAHEARGCDVTLPMQVKLRRGGTLQAPCAVQSVRIILSNDICHVAIGKFWYRRLCAERQLQPVASYACGPKNMAFPRFKGRRNLEARRHAGFDQTELKLALSRSGRQCH